MRDACEKFAVLRVRRFSNSEFFEISLPNQRNRPFWVGFNYSLQFLSYFGPKAEANSPPVDNQTLLRPHVQPVLIDLRKFLWGSGRLW